MSFFKKKLAIEFFKQKLWDFSKRGYKVFSRRSHRVFSYRVFPRRTALIELWRPWSRHPMTHSTRLHTNNLLYLILQTKSVLTQKLNVPFAYRSLYFGYVGTILKSLANENRLRAAPKCLTKKCWFLLLLQMFASLLGCL